MIRATTECDNVNITDIQINAPLNSTITPLKKLFNSINLWQISLRIRANDVIDEYRMCYKAIDSSNQESNTTCLLLKSNGVSPRINEQKLYPSGSIEKLNSGLSYKFSCDYDIPIERPLAPAYISIYSSDTNQLVYSLDSSKSFDKNVVEFGNYSIEFSVPSNYLISGSYYITLDAGILLV